MGVKTLALALVFFLFLGPGCFWVTTKHEGEEMLEKIKALEDRASTSETSFAERSRKLDETLEQATKLLTRTNADLGTQVDKMSDELAALTGKVEIMARRIEALLQAKPTEELASLKQRLDTLERQLGISTTPGAAPTMDKAQLFEQGTLKLTQGQYAEARRLFRMYVSSFPTDDKADNAQYNVGEAFYKEKDYEHAIAEFQRVIDTFPSGDMVDDAFLQAGTAALDNQWCVDAGAYLGELVRRYPSSPLAKTAKQKLDFIVKNKKNTKVCKAG